MTVEGLKASPKIGRLGVAQQNEETKMSVCTELLFHSEKEKGNEI